VTVRVEADEADAVVEVADRGVGIPHGDQARIFERFYRGSQPSQRRGFGLGLPIVRELVRAHGGRVDVSSAPGVGSTFRVTLPREASAPPAETPVSAARPREAAS
jgi:two-component system OmpR family sensor kinase